MNSSGLGSIIACHTTLKNAGGQLKLLRVSNKIESLLIVTRLNLVFETFQDEETAIASFNDAES